MIWYLLTSIVSPCPAAFKSTALGVSSGSADEIEKMLPWSAQKHKLTASWSHPSRVFWFSNLRDAKWFRLSDPKGICFIFFQRASCCFMLSHHAVPTPNNINTKRTCIKGAESLISANSAQWHLPLLLPEGASSEASFAKGFFLTQGTMASNLSSGMDRSSNLLTTLHENTTILSYRTWSNPRTQNAHHVKHFRKTT